jgi:RimJ/RimL family protein N-acetyltransferase
VGLIYYSEPTRSKECAWLCHIYIEPDFRRQGYATAAITQMEMHLRSLGIKRVGLNVFAHNSSAKRLYEAMGYTVIQCTPQIHSPEIACYQLMKDL